MNYKFNIELSLVSQNDSNEHKKIVIVLPRQLITVHSFCDNNVISLWELSLRKIYLSR